MLDGLMGFLSGANGSAATTTVGPGSMSSMSPDQWGIVVSNPNTTGGAGGSGIAGLFSDPNFINMLAGAGAAIDPNGVGGAVGKGVQQWNQNKQMGKAMEKQDQRWSALIEAMGKGQVGKANISEDSKTGKTSISLAAPENVGATTTPAGQLPVQPQVDPMLNFTQAVHDTLSKLGFKY